MDGIIGPIIQAGLISIQLSKRNLLKTINGQEIIISDKKYNHGTWIGCIIFKLGADRRLPRARVRPAGHTVASAALPILAAWAGTWTYCALRQKRPH
ncbi:hypothetical protein GCM10027346_36950 [Hymenobacter seoulensis]